MTAKKGKDAIQHDDVSGLFARLGTPASQGYHDFAYTQLSPRTSGLTQAHAPAAVEPITIAPDAVQPPVGLQRRRRAWACRPPSRCQSVPCNPS